MSSTHADRRTWKSASADGLHEPCTWVSSAYRCGWKPCCSTRRIKSAVYKINRIGPNTEPCGTLKVIHVLEDLHEPRRTYSSVPTSRDSVNRLQCLDAAWCLSNTFEGSRLKRTLHSSHSTQFHTLFKVYFSSTAQITGGRHSAQSAFGLVGVQPKQGSALLPLRHSGHQLLSCPRQPVGTIISPGRTEAKSIISPARTETKSNISLGN